MSGYVRYYRHPTESILMSGCFLLKKNLSTFFNKLLLLSLQFSRITIKTITRNCSFGEYCGIWSKLSILAETLQWIRTLSLSLHIIIIIIIVAINLHRHHNLCCPSLSLSLSIIFASLPSIIITLDQSWHHISGNCDSRCRTVCHTAQLGHSFFLTQKQL